MLQSTRWSPLALVLLLFALPVGSQTEASDPSAPRGKSDEASVPEAPVTRENTQVASENPFDYRASEEISEDVPVSFPVDI